jgi:hypothetical protein
MRRRPGRSGTGRPSSRAEGTGDGQGGAPAAGAGPAPGHLAAALTGLREPIVVLLLIIGFMSWISGKPLDGLLIILAGAGLAWDAGRRSRQTSPAVVSPAEASATTASPVEASPEEAGPTEASPEEAGPTEASPVEASPMEASPVEASPVKADPAAPEDAVLTATAAAPRLAGVTASGAAAGVPPAPIAGGPPARARRRRPARLAAGLAGGVLYAVVVGSFSRYSWPATVAVAGLGAAVVAVGWRGPRHTRPAPPRPPAVGLALWGAVFVAACLWELWSLLEQPNLAISSYAHPTISTLTDPVLSTWAGRSIVLAGWLALGWFLVER